jgi:hypothetical protein
MPLAPPPWTRRRWRARRRRGGARTGKQAMGNWNWAHQWLIDGGGSAGKVAGERRRQRRGDAPAGARTAVKEGVMLNNVLRRELPCGLGKTLGRSPGAEDRRRGKLDGGGPATAAGARAPAIMRLGLINKRLGEPLWCIRKSWGACGGEGVDGREVRTGRRQWRTVGLGSGCACAQGAAGAGFDKCRRSVRGSWG